MAKDNFFSLLFGSFVRLTTSPGPWELACLIFSQKRRYKIGTVLLGSGAKLPGWGTWFCFHSSVTLGKSLASLCLCRMEIFTVPSAEGVREDYTYGG